MDTAGTPVVRKARANRDLSQAAPKERARAKPSGERVEGGHTEGKGMAELDSLFFIQLLSLQG